MAIFNSFLYVYQRVNLENLFADSPSNKPVTSRISQDPAKIADGTSQLAIVWLLLMSQACLV